MAGTENSDIKAIGDHLCDLDATLAIAESLTGGELSVGFATAEGSSDWYRGAVVAYSSAVKHALLDVPDGPVVAERAVVAMVEHVVELLEADVGIAVSGVAGPTPQDDQPPGTVWLAIHLGGTTHTRLEHFEGDPAAVVDSTLRCAIGWLLELLRSK